MAITLPIFTDGSPAFDAALAKLRGRGAEDLEAVAPAVRAILADVRASGDEAVLRYVARFERRIPAALVQTSYDGAGALSRLAPEIRTALKLAAARIERYHRHQAQPFFSYEEEGVELGMRVRPLARVGVYAPGGKARYPSSVLMSAIPAKVAGVKDIVLATPDPDDLLLAAAHLAGVTQILDAGGAQAIGALAYGTASLARVDKIVGPGNAYVACAKKLVYGDVAIDGIAGPSEILVIADDGADPALAAADLLSQAEHDEDAYPMLLTRSEAMAQAVAAELAPQLAVLSRKAIIGASLTAHGVALVCPDAARMLAIADLVAAEHVALHLEDAAAFAERLSAAGAILVGGLTPVAAGDYLAGPSHVLPTGGAVRFGAPLGVYDFVTRSSSIRYTPAALARQAGPITTLARAEGLDAHARAVELRLERSAAPVSVRKTESAL